MQKHSKVCATANVCECIGTSHVPLNKYIHTLTYVQMTQPKTIATAATVSSVKPLNRIKAG